MWKAQGDNKYILKTAREETTSKKPGLRSVDNMKVM
jgi:hypothetical protein